MTPGCYRLHAHLCGLGFTNDAVQRGWLIAGQLGRHVAVTCSSQALANINDELSSALERSLKVWQVLGWPQVRRQQGGNCVVVVDTLHVRKKHLAANTGAGMGLLVASTYIEQLDHCHHPLGRRIEGWRSTSPC